MIRQKQAIFILGLFLPLSYVSAGTILSSYKYAWSNNTGYINFENVTVSDSALSGYAWSANSGYINFSPDQGGVLNDGAGNLSGSAWGASFGWIDFDGVSINGSTGKFSGTATGALVGTITFDCGYCDVQTDWRQVVAPTASSDPSDDDEEDEEDEEDHSSSEQSSSSDSESTNKKNAEAGLSKESTQKLSVIPDSDLPLNNTEEGKDKKSKNIDDFSPTLKKSFSERINDFFELVIRVFVDYFKVLWIGSLVTLTAITTYLYVKDTNPHQ